MAVESFQVLRIKACSSSELSQSNARMASNVWGDFWPLDDEYSHASEATDARYLTPVPKEVKILAEMDSWSDSLFIHTQFNEFCNEFSIPSGKLNFFMFCFLKELFMLCVGKI